MACRSPRSESPTGLALHPWYVLDGTHPEVQTHLEQVFRTLRTQWGIHYFKLDANFWGAIHGGRFHDPAATRVEAYRRGMAAILRGAGEGPSCSAAMRRCGRASAWCMACG